MEYSLVGILSDSYTTSVSLPLSLWDKLARRLSGGSGEGQCAATVVRLCHGSLIPSRGFLRLCNGPNPGNAPFPCRYRVPTQSIRFINSLPPVKVGGRRLSVSARPHKHDTPSCVYSPQSRILRPTPTYTAHLS